MKSSRFPRSAPQTACVDDAAETHASPERVQQFRGQRPSSPGRTERRLGERSPRARGPPRAAGARAHSRPSPSCGWPRGQREAGRGRTSQRPLRSDRPRQVDSELLGSGSNVARGTGPEPASRRLAPGRQLRAVGDLDRDLRAPAGTRHGRVFGSMTTRAFVRVSPEHEGARSGCNGRRVGPVIAGSGRFARTACTAGRSDRHHTSSPSSQGREAVRCQDVRRDADPSGKVHTPVGASSPRPPAAGSASQVPVWPSRMARVPARPGGGRKAYAKGSQVGSEHASPRDSTASPRRCCGWVGERCRAMRRWARGLGRNSPSYGLEARFRWAIARPKCYTTETLVT